MHGSGFILVFDTVPMSAEQTTRNASGFCEAFAAVCDKL
jgi:hypothetical protein